MIVRKMLARADEMALQDRRRRALNKSYCMGINLNTLGKYS